MPTPMWVFAAVAYKRGGVDPDDQEAVSRFYEELGVLGDEVRQEAILTELLQGESLPHERSGKLLTGLEMHALDGKCYAVVTAAFATLVLCQMFHPRDRDNELVALRLMQSTAALFSKGSPMTLVGSSIDVQGDQPVLFSSGFVGMETELRDRLKKAWK